MEWHLSRPEDMIAAAPGSAGDSVEEQVRRNVFFARLEDLIAWAREQKPSDNFDQAFSELKGKGLTY